MIYKLSSKYTIVLAIFLLSGCDYRTKTTLSNKRYLASQKQSASELLTGPEKYFSIPDLKKATRFKLLKVVDGDSLLILKDGKTTQIRLIGIDAPEISVTKKTLSDSRKSHLDLKSISSLGHKSKKHLKEILKNDSELKLITGAASHDHYGRMLAYAFTEDNLFINLKMLQDGYAKAYTVAPNNRFANQFREAEEHAKNSKIGLWALLN